MSPLVLLLCQVSSSLILRRLTEGHGSSSSAPPTVVPPVISLTFVYGVSEALVTVPKIGSVQPPVYLREVGEVPWTT